MDSGVNIKTKEEIKVMAEGGALLAGVRETLRKNVVEGVDAYTIEELAVSLIAKTGGTPSFKTVPKYSWATCVNLNSDVVHGIPKRDNVFKKGDIVSVDVGLLFKGFHTDTSFSVGIAPDHKMQTFLRAGEAAVTSAIKKCVAGNRVYDLSLAMEKVVVSAGYTPVWSLVGHGIGRNLHEEPAVPCVIQGERSESFQLKEGLVLAIEIMYGEGSGEIYKKDDGWTLSMRDGKISGLFEETVAVTADGPFVLTKVR